MINKLKLRNFRNHPDLPVEFSSDSNFIIGPNGSGKTSVLEAIYTTLHGSSWRGSSDDMVQHNQDWASVKLTIDGSEYQLKLDGRDGRLQKTRLINGESKRSGFPTVLLLEPNMIELVAGGPRGRREWLDQVLSQADSDYAHTLSRYERSLSQRNALLKREVRDKDQLFVWNIKLAELGAKLAAARFELIASSHGNVVELFSKVAGYDKALNLSYQAKFDVTDYSQNFMNYLEDKLERDIAIGFTPAGPHREDVAITAESGPARDHLSRGEQLILVFALVYSQATNLNPVAVLLDDYTSDLDQQKSKKLLTTIKQQTIIARANTYNQQKQSIALSFD